MKQIQCTPKFLNHHYNMKFLIYKFQFGSFQSLIIFTFLIILTHHAQFCNQTSTAIITCYPCYYRCKQCSDVTPNDCISCTKQYILINKTCKSCGDNCYSCKNITDISNINQQNIQSLCQTCIQGYYLSQSTGKCIKCSQGVQTCTLSAIQSCLYSFYQSNGVCLKCQQNCLNCIDSTACQICDDAFYLNNLTNNCQSCQINNCQVCDGLNNCISCNDGYSGSNCTVICPQNCAICDSGVCFVCKSNFYMLNGSCLSSRLLCQSSSSYQRCDQCYNDLSYLSQTMDCIPFYTVHDQNRIIYLTAINNLDQFSTLSPVELLSKADTKLLLHCQSSQVYMVNSQTKTIYTSILIEPCYKIFVSFQILSSSEIIQLSILINSQILQTLNQTINNKSSIRCGNLSFYLLNYQISFELSDTFNSTSNSLLLQFGLLSQNISSFGMTQMYLQLYRCQIKNCLMCKSAYTCQSCFFPYRLQNNQCLKICQEGYYYTEINSSITCTLQCFKGFYAVRQDYTCKACQWPCIECQDQNICTRCNYYDNYTSSSLVNQTYLLFNSICVKTCPIKYFPNLQTYTCQECIFPCLECSSISICLSCQMGYLNKDLQKCVMKCPLGKYADFINLQCKSCLTPCTICQYTPLNCLQCTLPYFLFSKNNSCTLSCPNGYAQTIQSTKYCKQCEFPCKTCQSSSINCTSCLKGYLYVNQCYSQCPSMYFKSITSDLNNVCKPCINNCFECQDQTICISCQTGYKFHIQEKSCIEQCPKGTFEQKFIDANLSAKTKCIPCQPPCFYCTNATYCLSCTGQCLLQCPIGTYIFYNSILQQRQCMQCSATCISCLSNNSCYECKDGWLLWEGICYNICPNSTFSNQNGYKYCESCQYPCLTCINQYKCLSCVAGFLYQINNYKCVQFCADGYFQSLTNNTCMKCSIECQNCINLATNCLSCSLGYFYNQQTGKCTSQCQSGTYYSFTQRECRNCQWPCKTCQSYTSCTSCYQQNQVISNSSLSNYTIQQIFYLNHCITECPSGYYQNIISSASPSCIKCQIPCSECFNTSQTCTKCMLPLLMYNNPMFSSSSNYFIQCLEICPSGYYSKNYECQICQDPCKECLSNQLCTECIKDWYLLEGTCYEICPYHYFQSISKNVSICISCSDQCKQCIGNQANCTQCSKNYYLLTPQMCVKNCPIQYYPSSQLMECLPCEIPCLECYSKNYCKTCKIGYLMQLNKCVTSCDKKYYLSSFNSSLCTPCQTPCQKCQSQFQCISCITGYYYLEQNSSCVKLCPQKMYGHRIEFVSSSVSNQTFKGICLQCSQLCLQCSSYSICISCNYSTDLKYLQQSKCQTSCSEGYYYFSNINTSYPHQCLKCQQNCISCTSQNVCQKCLSSYLFNNKCFKQCPKYFYKSSTFTCQNCKSPCNQCFNQFNCINCADGYFLYNDICVKKCPLAHWTDLQLKQCVIQCDQRKFFNQVNRTCLVKCQNFYSYDSKCLDTCSNTSILYNFINSTQGCQECQNLAGVDCSQIMQKLQYKFDYIVLNGKLYIIFKFRTLMNTNISYANQQNGIQDEMGYLLLNYFNFTFQKKLFIDRQLEMNFLKAPSLISILYSTLMNSSVSTLSSPFKEIQNQETNFNDSFFVGSESIQFTSIVQSQDLLKLIHFLPNSLWLQIDGLPQNMESFSGFLNYQIKQYLQLVSQSSFKIRSKGSLQQLPLQQILMHQTQLRQFSPSRKIPDWISSFSYILANILSYIILALILINLMFDNLRSQFYLIDFIQNLFLIFWIGNYVENGLSNFLKGFSIANFHFESSYSIQTQDFIKNIDSLSIDILWNCNSKNLIHGNSCQFMENYIILGAIIGIFGAIIGVCKIIIYLKPIFETRLKIHHKIIYNHINNFYWLFISPIFFISTSQFLFQKKMQNTSIFDLILIIFSGLLTLVLGYQVLKNIFNCSFQERTFFWGLKCHKIQNSQANIHFLLLMIRKSIILVAVALSNADQNKQLVYFFLIILVSIIILSNILANSPFKKKSYQQIIVVGQSLIILFYLAIEIYIVSVKKFNQEAFVIYNCTLLVLVILIIVLYLILALIQTYKHIKKKYLQYKLIEQNSNQDDSKSSSYDTSQRSIKQKTKRHKKRDLQRQSQKYTFLPAQIQKNNKQKLKKNPDNISKRRSSLNDDIQTKQEKINNSQDNQMQSSSSGFDFRSIQNSQQFSQPAKYLIKLQKKPNTQEQSSN